MRSEVSGAGMRLFTSKGAPWAGGTVLLLLAAALLFFFTGGASTEPSRAPEPGPNDITFGAESAKVIVIEYSDFECVYCAAYAPMLARLREDYEDRIQFVFRFFPLRNHDYALISAQAAYAASLQGKFWEMHDILYEDQERWSQASDPLLYFQSYASLLNLDTDRFNEDMRAESTTDFIRAEHSEGARAGISHTPWFIINDTVVFPRTPDALEKSILEAL